MESRLRAAASGAEQGDVTMIKQVWLAGAALAGLCAAAPALAGTVTPANQEAHLATLFTDAGNDCLDMDKLTNDERVPFCNTALSEVAARRKALTDPSKTEVANLDFYEAVVLIALASAYSRLDGGISERTCETAERSWMLSYGLLSVPRSAVSADFYSSYQDVPQSVNSVLDACRSKFGTPAYGAPLPGAKAT
ncbi:hypothetical protein [Novosphingobium sp.]|uniref:hypothetical protein n=1 Tax=Novosphingobium sp. TaxID=1874826 RepID=UPI00286AD2C7|nr:hypothetical protein [Novosphingobium sp.]